MINTLQSLAKIILLVCVMSGCATQRIVYIEPKPFQFAKTEQIKQRTIRVHPDDAELYSAYIDKLRSQALFHNNQIDSYLETFKKQH